MSSQQPQNVSMGRALFRLAATWIKFTAALLALGAIGGVIFIGGRAVYVVAAYRFGL